MKNNDFIKNNANNNNNKIKLDEYVVLKFYMPTLK